MKKYLKLQIGKRLKESRIKRFNNTVNMKEFAIMLGVKYRTYQNWEGGVNAPKREMYPILAKWLRVDVEWLEHGEKSQLPQSTKDLIKTYFPKESR